MTANNVRKVQIHCWGWLHHTRYMVQTLVDQRGKLFKFHEKKTLVHILRFPIIQSQIQIILHPVISVTSPTNPIGNKLPTGVPRQAVHFIQCDCQKDHDV